MYSVWIERTEETEKVKAKKAAPDDGKNEPGKEGFRRGKQVYNSCFNIQIT
jgi:hypothetical protein